MCTIVLAWRALADAPVAVAANRDEQLDRASEPPALLEDDPQVVAPRDARAGGTWIGVSEGGLAVAITNRWTEPPEEREADAAEDDGTGAEEPQDDRRSRGLLVRDALAAGSAAAALETVREAVEGDAYAGFNLLLADPDRAVYLEWDGAGERNAGTERDGATDGSDSDHDDPELRQRDLEPGVHVIVNPGLNGVDDRAARLRADLAVDGTPPAAAHWLDAAAARLRDHDYGVCVHGDGFGTRSSSLLAMFEPGAAAYAFADGPPCETGYEQVTPEGSFLEGSF